MTIADKDIFHTVLSNYPTGVAIITATTEEGEHLALVIGSFAAVSSDPPLVSFMPMKSSRTFERLAACPTMCINVLTAEQESVGRTIARRSTDKLHGLDWFTSPQGNPILQDSLAWLEVQIQSTVEAGDHWIALCEVLDLDVNNPVAPLLYFQGGYGAFVVPSLVARIDAEIADGVDTAVSSRAELEELATATGGECTLFKTIHDRELVAVATAGGTGRSGHPNLGRRLPLVPPIGDTWASSVDSERQEVWLQRASGAQEELVEAYRARLAFCRDNGYLITFTNPDNLSPFTELKAATSDYAASRPTPQQERLIRQRVTGASRPADYTPRQIDPTQTYNIASLMLPIQDPAGEVHLTLRLSDLPQSVSGDTVLGWIHLGQQTAADIAAA